MNAHVYYGRKSHSSKFSCMSDAEIIVHAKNLFVRFSVFYRTNLGWKKNVLILALYYYNKTSSDINDS